MFWVCRIPSPPQPSLPAGVCAVAVPLNDGAANPAPSSDGRCVLQDSDRRCVSTVACAAVSDRRCVSTVAVCCKTEAVAVCCRLRLVLCNVGLGLVPAASPRSLPLTMAFQVRNANTPMTATTPPTTPPTTPQATRTSQATPTDATVFPPLYLPSPALPLHTPPRRQAPCRVSPVSLVCRYCRRLIGSGRESVLEACLW